MDASQLVKTDSNPNIPAFGPGDSVKVNFRIREGDRERIQAFQGVVIRASRTATVPRPISPSGEFPGALESSESSLCILP